MPRLSQLAMKAAMIYLVTGALGAAAYWLNTVWPFWAPIAALNPTYLHLIVVGWLTQFIMAVMYWMFPVISKPTARVSAVCVGCLHLSKRWPVDSRDLRALAHTAAIGYQQLWAGGLGDPAGRRGCFVCTD